MPNYESRSELPPLLRLLTASFRVGRFFGVEVRIYALALAFIPLLLLPSLRWLPAADQWLLVAVFVVTGYVTIWLHEMGHIVAGWRYRIFTPLITISPLGGLAHMSAPAPSPKADIVIAAAGPFTHLVVLAVVYPLSLLAGSEVWSLSSGHINPGPLVLARLVELNVTLLLFNLLPFFPMDGGRILRALLALRMHPNRASLITVRVGFVGAVLLALAGIFLFGGFGGGLLVAIAITNALECQRERLAARYAASPYGEPREPWETDSEAWKHGERADADVERPRRVRPPRHPAAPAPPNQDDLDRLLDRVKEVGVAGLTEGEREALLRASAARRGEV